ncbi:hypothetical protein [Bacillus sp. FSL K6-6540]|uniref:hypothetical protein n=1 Tax=Bacillus sp. FSL K6-6540 TaxID=2921512 RepID=UPI0030F8DE95
MSKVIPFPKQNSAFEVAQQNLENRLGVSLFDYLGFIGDPEETEKAVAKSMQRETLKLHTQLIYK